MGNIIQINEKCIKWGIKYTKKRHKMRHEIKIRQLLTLIVQSYEVNVDA